jgi:hypothetical protein
LADTAEETLSAHRRTVHGPAECGVFSSAPTARMQRWKLR